MATRGIVPQAPGNSGPAKRVSTAGANKGRNIGKQAQRKPTVDLSNTYGIRNTNVNTNSAVTQGRTGQALTKATALGKVRG